MRVAQALKYWLENQFSDFDSEMVAKLTQFIAVMEATHSVKLADQIRKTLERVQTTKKEEEVIFLSKPPPTVIYPKRIDKSQLHLCSILDWHPTEVARQLTLIEFGMFRKIRVQELLNQSWNKENRETKARNIFELIQWFNLVSRWAASEIVLEQDLKKRAKKLDRCIQIAEECRKLHNYNAVFEIIASIQTVAVHRLKNTWAVLQTKSKNMYTYLYNLISRDGNFRNIRNAVVTSKPPVLPYIGLYLTDLTFIEDGNESMIQNRINFTKRRKLANLIRNLQSYQNTPYSLQPVSELQNIMKEMNPLGEQELYEESLLREPREPK